MILPQQQQRGGQAGRVGELESPKQKRENKRKLEEGRVELMSWILLGSTAPLALTTRTGLLSVQTVVFRINRA